jgi:hypothetical protein
VFGVIYDTPSPEWLADIAPPQKVVAIDAEFARVSQQLAAMQATALGLQQQRAAANAPLRLLYAQGEDLEMAVRNALAFLGAEVEPPSTPGKEDGWIRVTVGGRVEEAVLEIKSTRKNTFDEGGVRQLLDWRTRGIADRQVRYKPLFIGNPAADRPPHTRQPPFSTSWLRAAELGEIAAILTEDLYRAVLLHERGELNSDEFWSAIFTTNGEVDPSKLRAALALRRRVGENDGAT